MYAYRVRRDCLKCLVLCYSLGRCELERSTPCIRLACGKFELTNRDSEGGKNLVSSRQCKLTGKVLKSSNLEIALNIH